MGFTLLVLILLCNALEVQGLNSGRLDILVGVISSGSVQEDEFKIEKQFVLQMLENFHKFGECGVKVAMINYGNTSEVSWDFYSPIASDKDLIYTNTYALRHVGGDHIPSMVPVVELATNKVFTTRGDRATVPNVFLLINSEASRSISGLREAVQELKVVSRAIVIGVTNMTDEEELNIIAVNKQVYTVDDYDAIIYALQRLMTSRGCSDCHSGYSNEDVEPGQSFYTVEIKRKDKTTSIDGDDVLGPRKPVPLSPQKCIYVEGSDEFYVKKFCVYTKHADVIKFRAYYSDGKMAFGKNVRVKGHGKSFTDTCHTFRTKRKNNLKLVKTVKVSFSSIAGKKEVTAKNFYMDACGKKIN